MTRVEKRLRRLVRARGAVSFARFMEEALYGEDGYYRRPESPIGPSGDYLTASSSGRFFAATTAALLARLDGELGRAADYLEVGYGSGRHLAALLASLESGGDRRVLGYERGLAPPPSGADRLERLEQLPAAAMEGLVFSYELFDALPVHRLVKRGGSVRELFVTLRDDRFDWCEADLSDRRLEAWNLPTLEEDQVADVTPAWGELYGLLAERLGRGLLVTCDYGFSRSRLLDPRVRRHGTLACYRRHRVHRNPLVHVGDQDLTAHVDFSALIAAGESAGLETVGLFRQAEWLVANGLLEGAAGWSPEDRVAVQQLVDLEGVGEELRVLVQSRAVDAHRLLPSLA